MKVDTVSYGMRVPSSTLGQRGARKLPPVRYENKMVDILPISGLIGAGLMSVYFIKKGNLDIAMKALHV